jgi:predicted cupin superfamily sugar epimerase
MSLPPAEAVVAALRLAPHPEGGWYRETYRAAASAGERGVTTAIYFLLREGEASRWHRIDAIEIWHWYAGAPLALTVAPDSRSIERHRLGPDILAGERPQAVVPPRAWQSAASLGTWTLVGCTVAPAFEFSGFELAPLDWTPG